MRIQVRIHIRSHKNEKEYYYGSCCSKPPDYLLWEETKTIAICVFFKESHILNSIKGNTMKKNTIKKSYINAMYVRICSEKESKINATNIKEIKIVITVSLSFLMVRTNF